MIEINVDTLAWNDMTDEERVLLCDMMVNEFERLIPPLKNFTYNHDVKESALVVHDFLRVRTNCKMFAHDGATRNSALMWRSFLELRKINYFLELVVNPGIVAIAAAEGGR